MAVVPTTVDQLPPKTLLMDKLLELRYKYEIELVTAAFTDLRDCTAAFQESFMGAMKAIEHGNFAKMKDSIHMMKEAAGTCPGIEDYLDVYYLQSVVSKRKGQRTLYYMTLLAYSAIHNQRGMMEMLIDEGASLHLGNSMIGSPLSQVLVYSQHHECPNKVESAILEHLLKGALSDDLNVNILHTFAVGTGQTISICSPLELAILIQRIDAVKLMVKVGANPILADSDPSEAAGVIHLLSEYYEFGTNHYISWLLQEHLLSQEILTFIEKVFEVNIFNEDAMSMFSEVGRHPAHALLTCGNKEMIKKLLQIHGDSMLTVTDENGRTALQIAAGQGDLESVRILLNMYTENGDKSDVAKALLEAARGGHAKVVECILQKDNTLIVVKVSNDEELWKQAITEELTCVFEVLRNLDQTVMVGKFDDEDNTLGHIAALTGNSKLFKVVFPLPSLKLEPASTGDAQPTNQFRRLISIGESAQQKIQRGQFAALMWENSDEKTPLHIAIENKRTCIIQTLKERVDERESKPCAEQNMEKLAWDSFWEEWGPKLLLYACSYGSVDIVKLLVKDMMCSPNHLMSSGETPLSCAAKAGNDDIVNYLLSLHETIIPTSQEHSPLILAATNGYTRCVRILLKKGAAVTERNEEGRNCLMKAIERKHRDTALAILSDTKQGLKALQICDGNISPFRMLIEHMPDVAEWVLNKCALSAGVSKSTVTNNTVDPVSIEVDGAGLEDDQNENNTELVDSIQKLTATKGYTMENKFELLEDFQSYKPPPLQSYLDTDMATFSLAVDGSAEVQVIDSPPTKDSVHATSMKWGPKQYQTSNHPLKLMVDHDRESLLNHPLVKELLSYKWRRVGIPGLIIYFTCYMLFLIILTAFALVIPRPAPSDDVCPISVTTSKALDNGTIFMCEEIQVEREGFLYFAAIFLMLIAVIYLVFEALQLFRRKLQYLLEYDNYIQVALFVCSFIFVVPTINNSCWCTAPWKWQFGVVAVFLGWLNCIILLRNWPVWGRPAAMLLNVYLNFAKLVYLPILLILTFGFPFYMMFVRNNSTAEELIDFSTPVRSLWKVFLQTSGDIDAGTIFDDPGILYPVVGYALFIIFIIAMPILFNNFLIGMAVGETEEERRKAKLASIKTKVEYIFEIEDSIPFLRKFSFIDTTIRSTSTKLDDITQKEFQDRNDAVIDEIKAKSRTERMNLHMRQLAHDMTVTHEALNALKTKVALDQQKTTEAVGSLREDMMQQRTQTLELLTACQKDIMQNGQELFSSLRENVAIMKSELKEMKEIILQSTVLHGQHQKKND